MTDKIIIYPDGDDDTANDLGQQQLQRLHACGRFTLFTDVPADQPNYIERIQTAHTVLLGWNLPSEVMAAAPELELISFTGTGVEKFVDMAQAKARGITVCNVPGYGDNAVAEHAIALLFACARNIGQHQRNLQTGIWDQSPMGLELKGKKLGLVGFGGIGQRVGRIALGLGMEVSVWTRSPERYTAAFPEIQFKSFEQVLQQSDIVSLHLAHKAETENLLDQAAFAMIKPGAILINTARGELIDEAALVEALNNARLGGAGLDVFRTEPIPGDHPLTNMNNVVLTPHVGYSTAEANRRLNRISVDNIINFYAGDPTNVVTL